MGEISDLIKVFIKLRNVLRDILSSPDVMEIGRRYFITNFFDTTLGMLGLIMGSLVAGVHEPKIIIGAGFGSAIALSLSGLAGTYIAERAERKRKISEIERSMLTSLKGSLLEKTEMLASIIIAFMSGTAPLISSTLILIPFMLSYVGFIKVTLAFPLAILESLLILFILGLFMGKISGENVIVYGLITMLLGLSIALIGLLLR